MRGWYGWEEIEGFVAMVFGRRNECSYRLLGEGWVGDVGF